MADYDLQYQDTHIDALLATANELKTAGYIYKGVATPSTNPGTPTDRVAYLASEPGTYTNFGGIVIASGLYSLTYAGGTWTGTLVSAGSDIEVVQTTGQSTSAIMSQKAVTDYIVSSYEVEGLVQGYITQQGNLQNLSTRVSTDFLDATENAILLTIKNGYCIRTANQYDSDGEHIAQILNSADYTSYTFGKGYKYRVTFCNKSNPSANITPSGMDNSVFASLIPNESIYGLEQGNKRNVFEISAINNLKEDIDGGGVAVATTLLQGYITPQGDLRNLSTRVSTDYIDASKTSIILKVAGNYAVRNGNRYSLDLSETEQIVSTDLLDEILLPMGYKYRMTICNKSNLSANITPQMVSPYVALSTPAKREIVVKLNDTEQRVSAIELQQDKAGKYLISDFFTNNGHDVSNYVNFSASNLSSGHYNIAAGWTNTLKMSKVVSFQDFAFEFDVNVTNNTEKIVVATEVTEAVAASIYGSCAYIDMNAAKMYLLKPKLYNDSNQPNISSSNIAAQIALTNITSSGHRYIVSFGKKDRNLFVKFRNYYTNDIVELICTDTNNTSLAGSGYDKIRVGSMSGEISLNSIMGTGKTETDIMFVGDSITDGRNIPLADSWAYKLGAALTDNFVINARAGGQIQQVIDFLSAYGQTINAKVIVVSVGVNGGNTTSKFDELYNIIQSLHAIPVINTIYNVGSDFSNITEQEWNDINAYILSLPCKHIRFDLASSANKYTPVFKTLDPAYTLTDSVHPDSAGSVLLYQRGLADLEQIKTLL